MATHSTTSIWSDERTYLFVVEPWHTLSIVARFALPQNIRITFLICVGWIACTKDDVLELACEGASV